MTSLVVFNQDDIVRVSTRISHEIIERNSGSRNIILIGVRRRGALLANRLKKIIKTIDGISVPVYSLDITNARDDLTKEETHNHLINETVTGISISNEEELGIYPQDIMTVPIIDFTNFNVIIVDDVLYTGRTIRAAMDALLSFGRPTRIELLVLIDRRFNRELPIQPDFIGKSIDTIENINVEVNWAKNNDEENEVIFVHE